MASTAWPSRGLRAGHARIGDSPGTWEILSYPLNIAEKKMERQGRSPLDVRKFSGLPKDKTIFLVSGECGQGKTWRLIRIAHDFIKNGLPTFFITACGDADKDLAKIAGLIWQDCLDFDSELQLKRIATRHKTLKLPRQGGKWLTVCIDGVSDCTEAKELIEENWESWGINLILTVPIALGRTLNKHDGHLFHFEELGNFSLAELRNYMSLRQKCCASLPSDVRNILFRPIIAKLYCDINESGTWTPTSEYEVLKRFWKRIIEEHSQVYHLGDKTYLLKLIEFLLQDNPVYPWAAETQYDEVICRLERLGWLIRSKAL